MATWNRANLIGRAIQSVCDQTFKDWELLVIDDGSPDNTETVVQEWQRHEPRIRYIKVPHRGSIAIVSNDGLRAARGEFIAILDDDDWWCDAEKLAKQVAFLDSHPDCVACGGGIILVDTEGREIGRTLKKESDAEIRGVALFANPLVNSTTLFRRAASAAVGDYDETLSQFADWDFWLKLGNQGAFYNFPEHFAAYRVHPGSSSFRRQRENAISAIRIVKRYRRIYPGFWKGMAYAYGYRIYAALPEWFRRATSGFLLVAKKKIFAR